MQFCVDSNHKVTLQLIWPFNHIRQVAPHSQLAGAVTAAVWHWATTLGKSAQAVQLLLLLFYPRQNINSRDDKNYYYYYRVERPLTVFVHVNDSVINIHGCCRYDSLQRSLPCTARVIKNRIANVYDKSQLSLKVNCSTVTKLCLLSTHADRHVVDISVTVCLFVFFVRRIFVTDISGVGWRRAMKFCRMVDLGVRQVFSPSVNFSPGVSPPRAKK